MVARLHRAWQANDIPALVGLLDPEATMVVDGGGIVNAATRPVVGATRIADYIVQLAGTAGRGHVVERLVNARPGLVLSRNGRPTAVVAFDVHHDRITRIWAMRNPQKLHAWS